MHAANVTNAVRPIREKITRDSSTQTTACLSGVAKLARRERGEKNTVRASAVENWSTSLRGTSAVVVFAQYFLFFLYNTYIY